MNRMPKQMIVKWTLCIARPMIGRDQGGPMVIGMDFTLIQGRRKPVSMPCRLSIPMAAVYQPALCRLVRSEWRSMRSVYENLAE